MRNWKNIMGLIEYPREGILSKVIADGGMLEATLFCMAKGAKMGEHTSTREALVYVVGGEGVFNLKGERIMMKPGVVIHMGKKTAHSLEAKKNTAFLLVLA